MYNSMCLDISEHIYPHVCDPTVRSYSTILRAYLLFDSFTWLHDSLPGLCQSDGWQVCRQQISCQQRVCPTAGLKNCQGHRLCSAEYADSARMFPEFPACGSVQQWFHALNLEMSWGCRDIEKMAPYRRQHKDRSIRWFDHPILHRGKPILLAGGTARSWGLSISVFHGHPWPSLAIRGVLLVSAGVKLATAQVEMETTWVRTKPVPLVLWRAAWTLVLCGGWNYPQPQPWTFGVGRKSRCRQARWQMSIGWWLHCNIVYPTIVIPISSFGRCVSASRSPTHKFCRWTTLMQSWVSVLWCDWGCVLAMM